MTISFICRSCEYANRVETGMDGYAQRVTEFDFTDAVLHVVEMKNHHVDVIVDAESVRQTLLNYNLIEPSAEDE